MFCLLRLCSGGLGVRGRDSREAAGNGCGFRSHLLAAEMKFRPPGCLLGCGHSVTIDSWCCIWWMRLWDPGTHWTLLFPAGTYVVFWGVCPVFRPSPMSVSARLRRSNRLGDVHWPEGSGRGVCLTALGLGVTACLCEGLHCLPMEKTRVSPHPQTMACSGNRIRSPSYNFAILIINILVIEIKFVLGVPLSPGSFSCVLEASQI